MASLYHCVEDELWGHSALAGATWVTNDLREVGCRAIPKMTKAENGK